jgi:predicted DNA-binding protein
MSSEELFSDKEDKGNGGKVKTLAVQLKPEVHEQLTLIAKLKGKPITHEIREAIEAHIEAAKSAPELVAQAASVLEEIDREAASRREAIAGLVGSKESPPVTSSGRSRGRKPKDEEKPEG